MKQRSAVVRQHRHACVDWWGRGEVGSSERRQVGSARYTILFFALTSPAQGSFGPKGTPGDPSVRIIANSLLYLPSSSLLPAHFSLPCKSTTRPAPVPSLLPDLEVPIEALRAGIRLHLPPCCVTSVTLRVQDMLKPRSDIDDTMMSDFVEPLDTDTEFEYGCPTFPPLQRFLCRQSRYGCWISSTAEARTELP
jgi:hypothetical protein